MLPVTPRSRVSQLTLVAQQLSFSPQVAGGAEAIIGAKWTSLLWLLLRVLIVSVALSQRGEREEEEEEEKRTEAS